jgi:hypothetical protein
MTINAGVVASNGAKGTVSFAAPVVNPATGIWTGGTVTNTAQFLTDLSSCYEPAFRSAPVTAFPHLQPETTPYGPGFGFTCTDADVAIWSSSDKTVLARVNDTEHLGTTAQWTFPIYLPSQTFPNTFFCGLLWELHTLANQAHSIQIDTTQHGTPTAPWWKVYVQYDSGGNNVHTYYAGPIALNTWHQVVLQAKWAEDSTGFQQWFVDGALIANYSGQTYWASFGDPYLQFGYYSQIGGGLTNTVFFGPIVRRQF